VWSAELGQPVSRTPELVRSRVVAGYQTDDLNQLHDHYLSFARADAQAKVARWLWQAHLRGKKTAPTPERGPFGSAQTSVLLLHDACAPFRTGGSGDIDLGMTVVRIAPTPPFEQAV
jgi:hypothetical protein